MASIITSTLVTLDVEGFDVTVVADLEVGIVYPLTACCGASAKGSGSGVVCRACYRPVPATLGAGWTLAEAADGLFCGTCGDQHHHCPHSPLRGLGTEERA